MKLSIAFLVCLYSVFVMSLTASAAKKYVAVVPHHTVQPGSHSSDQSSSHADSVAELQSNHHTNDGPSVTQHGTRCSWFGCLKRRSLGDNIRLVTDTIIIALNLLGITWTHLANYVATVSSPDCTIVDQVTGPAIVIAFILGATRFQMHLVHLHLHLQREGAPRHQLSIARTFIGPLLSRSVLIEETIMLHHFYLISFGTLCVTRWLATVSGHYEKIMAFNIPRYYFYAPALVLVTPYLASRVVARYPFGSHAVITFVAYVHCIWLLSRLFHRLEKCLTALFISKTVDEKSPYLDPTKHEETPAPATENDDPASMNHEL